MLNPVGFWSYARHDDEHSDGQLSQLRVIVGKQIGLQHGGDVTLWQDINAIDYGSDWAAEIDRTINQTSFFLPIVTPRFLKSEYCFKEFDAFRQKMIALGRNDLVFPVHYVNVDGMRQEDTVFGAELMALRKHQWIDFRPFLYADPRSGEVRHWAGDLATGILKALRKETVKPEIGTTLREEAQPSVKETMGPKVTAELSSTDAMTECAEIGTPRGSEVRPIKPGQTLKNKETRFSSRVFIVGTIFLVIALVAGLLGFGGVAGTAMQGAQLLLWVAIILLVISLVFGLARRR